MQSNVRTREAERLDTCARELAERLKSWVAALIVPGGVGPHAHLDPPR